MMKMLVFCGLLISTHPSKAQSPVIPLIDSVQVEGSVTTAKPDLTTPKTPSSAVRKPIIRKVRPLTKGENRQLRAAMDHNLKDSASARFRGTFATVDDGGTVYGCGEVNAKNSYGGYIGYRGFIAWGLQAIQFEEDSQIDRAAFRMMWESYCTQSN